MTTERTETTPSLHEIIHDESYRLAWEQLVFEVANELAHAFEIRGNGRRLVVLLEGTDPDRQDAEVLLRLVIETLLESLRQDKPRLLGRLIDHIRQAQVAAGVAA
jgi:hypothetical protein